MYILVLEDDPMRRESFKQLLLNHDVYVTDSAEECIDLLQAHDFDIAFLDHDLGGPYDKPELLYDPENCGTTVANWIVNNNPVIKKIIIHSLNYPASLGMLYKLRRKYECIYVPFAWQKMTFESLKLSS